VGFFFFEACSKNRHSRQSHRGRVRHAEGRSAGAVDGGKNCDGDDERVEHDARGGASTAADSDASLASMGDRNPYLFLQPPANYYYSTVLF